MQHIFLDIQQEIFFTIIFASTDRYIDRWWIPCDM